MELVFNHVGDFQTRRLRIPGESSRIFELSSSLVFLFLSFFFFLEAEKRRIFELFLESREDERRGSEKTTLQEEVSREARVVTKRGWPSRSVTKERNINVERDIHTTLSIDVSKRPFTEEEELPAVTIGRHRCRSRGPTPAIFLLSTLDNAHHSVFSLPLLPSRSRSARLLGPPICRLLSSVRLAEPFLHPDTPTHPSGGTKRRNHDVATTYAHDFHMSRRYQHHWYRFGALNRWDRSTRTRQQRRFVESIFILPRRELETKNDISIIDRMSCNVRGKRSRTSFKPFIRRVRSTLSLSLFYTCLLRSLYAIFPRVCLLGASNGAQRDG